MVQPELFDPEKTNISPEGIKLRNLYCACMRRSRGKANYGKYVIAQYDGGRSKSGRKHAKNTWDALAEKLRAEHVDAGPYVEYIMSKFSIDVPNMVFSAPCLADYRRHLESTAKANRWEYEEKSVLTQLSILLSLYPSEQSKVLSRVLNDDQIGASPLVRYAWACKNNCQYLTSDRTKQRAKDQYLLQHFYYDQFYADRVPQEFKDAGK